MVPDGGGSRVGGGAVAEARVSEDSGMDFVHKEASDQEPRRRKCLEVMLSLLASSKSASRGRVVRKREPGL